MKLLLVFAICGLVAAAPNVQKHEVIVLDNIPIETRNWMLDVLIDQFINILRSIIKNGMGIVGIPPLDPLKLDKLHLSLPVGLINLDLELEKVVVSGAGGFVVHQSKLDVNEVSFNFDLSIPRLEVSAGVYNLTGDLFTAVPIYGLGKAEFLVEDFRIKAKFFLKQSADGKSIIFDRIEGATYEIPSFKSNLDGAIGGGDIDAIVNAVIEEVIVGYVNRFRGAICNVGTALIVTVGNPILELFDTWQFLAPFLPK